VPWFWFKHVGNFGVIAAWLLPPRRQCTLCVHIFSLYATRWPVLLTCMQLFLVSWYVAGMLCCHCWMFILSNTSPMQSYPSKVWFLCVAVQSLLFVFYRSVFLYEIGGISWLTLWRCWLHSCRMFIIIVEYGLVHRGNCINCETRNFCFDPAFVWPSLGRADFA